MDARFVIPAVMPVAIAVALTPDNPHAGLFGEAAAPPPPPSPLLPSTDMSSGWSCLGDPITFGSMVLNWGCMGTPAEGVSDLSTGESERVVCALSRPIPAGSSVGFSCTVGTHTGGELYIGLYNAADPVANPELMRIVSDGTAIGAHSANITYGLAGTQHEYTHAFMEFVAGKDDEFVITLSDMVLTI